MHILPDTNKHSVNICGMSMGHINELLINEKLQLYISSADDYSKEMMRCSFSYRRWEISLLYEKRRHLDKGGQGLEF